MIILLNTESNVHLYEEETFFVFMYLFKAKYDQLLHITFSSKHNIKSSTINYAILSPISILSLLASSYEGGS